MSRGIIYPFFFSRILSEMHCFDLHSRPSLTKFQVFDKTLTASHHHRNDTENQFPFEWGDEEKNRNFLKLVIRLQFIVSDTDRISLQRLCVCVTPATRFVAHNHDLWSPMLIYDVHRDSSINHISAACKQREEEKIYSKFIRHIN